LASPRGDSIKVSRAPAGPNISALRAVMMMRGGSPQRSPLTLIYSFEPAAKSSDAELMQ
jgi:hypothetical protein